MPADHPHHVALWLAEVFGGPAEYSEHHGGYAHMVAKHIGLSLTEPQRARWVHLIGLAADDAGLPSDPEFRSAFIAYIEWGTRLALHNSQPGADPPLEAPMPHWGWGEAPPINHKWFSQESSERCFCGRASVRARVALTLALDEYRAHEPDQCSCSHQG
jgi:hemoglobin